MLMRFDPFRELDRFTEDRWNRQPAVAMDAVRREHQVEVSFDLPGIDPDSVELTVERNVLTLKAERHPAGLAEGEEWIARERRYGTFSRQLFLGETLDANQINARYDNGVLYLTIPVAETAKPRRVTIEGGTGAPRSIDTNASEPVAN